LRSSATTYSASPSRTADFCRFTHSRNLRSCLDLDPERDEIKDLQINNLQRCHELSAWARGRSHGLQNSHRRGGESASICQKWGLILTVVQLASKLDLPRLVHFKQKRTWARVSWICAVVLLLMTSAQSAHMCGLAGELRLHHGKAAQADNIDSPHTFCAICASSHSPSFAVSLTSLPSIDSLTERSLQRSIVRRSSSPVFALYTRPPPAV
jgi:hypothetical protein